MIKGKYLRYACLVTAFVNAFGNLGLMLIYRPLFDLLGIPVPIDLHYFYWMAGLSFTNGVLAYYIFDNPEENRALLKVGIVGKGIFSLMTFYFCIFHGIHWFFLILGLWDAIFVLIFWIYLIQLQAPDLTRMNSGELLPGRGHTSRKAMILYYSLTGTGAASVERIQKGLETTGYSVDTIQVRPVDKKLFHFPFDSVLSFISLTLLAILRRKARVEPLNLPSDHDYDLIIIESQTWFVGMSAIVEAIFQNEDNRPFFQGRDAVAIIVCRGLWRRSQAMLMRHLEEFGSNVIGTQAYTHVGWEPSRLFSLAAYFIYGKTEQPVWLKWFLQPRCSLSDSSLDALEVYSKKLANR